ncbi:MAG: hypothetical protein IT317_13585 [Anaerolineales bacterium]|nr:hypothetical protein [Anaerolineales bacterium]
MSYPDDGAFNDVVVFGVLVPAGLGALAQITARPAESGDVGQEVEL